MEARTSGPVTLTQAVPLLERLLAISRTGVVVCDVAAPDAPIVYVNELFERITGYSASEAIGRNCRFLQGEGSSSQARRIMREAIERGEETMVTVLNYRRDGSSFFNEVRLAPVGGADEALRYYVGLISDVSDRVGAESKVSHAEILRSTVFDALVS